MIRFRFSLSLFYTYGDGKRGRDEHNRIKLGAEDSRYLRRDYPECWKTFG